MLENRQKGFSIIELMIVVAVLGLLAAMSIPSYVRARQNAQNGKFVADLRVATGAFQEYAIAHGRYPEDKNPAVIPDGMAEYLTRMHWTEETSLGGQWDWDSEVFGVIAGVSVYQPSASVEQLTLLDQMIDDGNLAAGSFRQRSSGYITVIE